MIWVGLSMSVVCLTCKGVNWLEFHAHITSLMMTSSNGNIFHVTGHLSPHKGQWRGALMFSLIYVSINDWVNNREAGDVRCYHAHYDVIVMLQPSEAYIPTGSLLEQMLCYCQLDTQNKLVAHIFTSEKKKYMLRLLMQPFSFNIFVNDPIFVTNCHTLLFVMI